MSNNKKVTVIPARKKINKSMNYFFTKVKPIVFDMWDYYFRVFCDYPLDCNSYEKIM